MGSEFKKVADCFNKVKTRYLVLIEKIGKFSWRCDRTNFVLN